ncbi:MAG: hypothetical protein Q7S00_02990 [bacterium]|nr:hypothetical protein [bacterium]
MRPYLLIFFYGVLAACFALILELILFGILPLDFFSFLESRSETHFSLPFFTGLFLFALVEEASRLLFLHQHAKRVSFWEFSSQSILVLGLAFGVGFASVEGLFRFLFEILPDQNFFFSGALLLHVLISVGFAFLLFRQKFGPLVSTLIFSLALLLHLGYNVYILLFSSF